MPTPISHMSIARPVPVELEECAVSNLNTPTDLNGIASPILPSQNHSVDREGLGYSKKPKVKIKAEKFRAIVQPPNIRCGIPEGNSFHIYLQYRIKRERSLCPYSDTCNGSPK